ncbi:MAG: cytochrome c [Acidobacteria bacterium]|nr:cytochrome c [Acidobacteriota bacterium]
MRIRSILRAGALAAAAAILAGCAGQTTRNTPIEVFPDMDRQPKYRPQRPSEFFADGRASRAPVAGTVARGQLKLDDAFYTGVAGNQYVGRNPLPINSELLKLGQTRFNTFCSPCHDRTGQGRGIVGQRAMWLPTNLQEDRVRQMNDGEIFTIITEGRRSMPSYRFQIAGRDRWAIIAYVRALQRTTGSLDDVPRELRAGVR